MGTVVTGESATGQPVDPEANEMFPRSVALRPTFEKREADLSDVLGLTAEQRTAEQQDVVAVARETDLYPTVVGLIYDAHVNARLSEARGDDAPDHQRLKEASRGMVRERWGDEGEALLARADKFVQAHPKLAKLLQAGGVGSRPEVVAALVEHVRRHNLR